MKKAGIFKSKLALIMYTLARAVCILSIKYRHGYLFFSFVWICRKNASEAKCETSEKEGVRDS